MQNWNFKKHLSLGLTAVLATILLASPAAHSAPNACPVMFTKISEAFEMIERSESARTKIKEILEQNPAIPAFVKQTPHGDLPVILVTADTAPTLKPIFENSMGTMFAQQLGYKNDHGLLRVNRFIIDADTPGARGFGEINQTGPAWKELQTYMDRRRKSEDKLSNIVEVGFVLTQKEQQSALFYQAVRRAAIFRVPFTYGANREVVDARNALSAGEHCFVFCKGAANSSHISEIQNKMRALGIKNPDAFIQTPEVVQFLNEARDLLVNKTKNDESEMNWNRINSSSLTARIESLLPQNLTNEEQKILINWIIALEVSTKYEALRDSLGLTSDGGFRDMRSSRASFIAMYGKSTDAPKFRDATFSSDGVFYSWTNEDQAPLEYKKIPTRVSPMMSILSRIFRFAH
jgi:hypothetical protein